VLFDRCRILDYAHELPQALLRDCARWTKAALRSSGITA
jgi:hypothetical protein